MIWNLLAWVVVLDGDTAGICKAVLHFWILDIEEQAIDVVAVYMSIKNREAYIVEKLYGQLGPGQGRTYWSSWLTRDLLCKFSLRRLNLADAS